MSVRCAECLNEAIERCEVTGTPLCAGCLWYTEDGRRVSERVAKQLAEHGVTIYSPELYLNQLGTAAELPRLPEAPPINTKHRNGNDLIALLAGISGVLSIATCFGVGIALCVPPLPLLPLLLGSIGLVGSRGASNPSQARLLSWIGIAGGAGFVALVMLLIVGSLAFGTTTMLTTVFTPRFIPTPTPTLAP
jgi:thiol:disulfide interchange protein